MTRLDGTRLDGSRLDGTRLDGPPRPQAAEPPKIASRMPQSVPTPKAAPLRHTDEKPLADKLAPAPAPMQQSAAVQAKPAAPAIQPTQPMPKVQDFE